MIGWFGSILGHMIEIDISGPKGTKSEAQAAFDLATAFFEGALRSATPVKDPFQPGAVVCPMPPAIVSAAFAIELFLKSAALAASGSSPKSHRIDKLFNSIPADLQKKIRKRYCELSGTQTIKVRDHLVQISNAFVDWRYTFENAMQISLSRLFYFGRAAYEVIRETHPGWTVNPYLDSRIRSEPDPVLHVANLGGGSSIRTVSR